MDLFQGFSCERVATQTVEGWLREIDADSRNHRQLGADSGFGLRDLVPTPFRHAINTVALREGWQPECLLQEILTNIGWLEHHRTRLKLTLEEEHARSPNIPHFMGGDPSSRKSSKKEFAARLLDCGECPDELRNGWCTCADGTIKGVRTGIENYNRSGVESDEVSNTYETPFSEQGKGIHYLGRSKMATYVNCEKDSSMTGLGNTTLTAYSFMHRVSGQTEAVECAISGGAVEFQGHLDRTP